MIEFKNITKTFGFKEVFSDINLTIQSGDLTAIIGTSGVGKTTLIHMLLGAEKPDTGSIIIDGYDISHLKRHELQLMRRHMGVIFQDFKLLPKKTVFENVAFAMEACGNTDFEISEKVPTVLHKVGLKECQGKFPHQLSGGERQRVAIARALVHKPSLLIADEPTGNLDPDNTMEIGNILKKINREDNITILIATHDKHLVEHLRPRVVHIQDGKVVRDEKRGTF